MKLKLHHTPLICFLLISNLVFSQQKSDTASLGSQFLFPQFTEGVIVLAYGNVCRGKLNYDTSLEQLNFLGTKNEILAIADPAKVIKVSIANRDFIYIKDFLVEIISTGSVSLRLRVHQKRTAEKIGAYGGVSPSASIESLSSVKLSDGTYAKLSPHEMVSFKNELFFYLLHNGKTKLVYNQKELLKCFPSNKALLKQEIERQHTKFDSIDSMKKIVDWINANGIIN